VPRKIRLALAIGLLLAPSVAFAQAIVVTGVVRDDAAMTVPGALVTIPALNLRQVANDIAEYRFTLPNAQPGQEIVIEARSLGHAPARVTLVLRAGVNTQNLTLAKRAVQIEGVVVSGTAGRQEKRAQSATVASIDAAKIAEVAPVTNVQNMLTARTPGVVLQNRSGTTGTAADIRIRGASSITLSNDPLVYIDGIRVSGDAQQIYGVGNQQGTRLNDIKIEDIESIEVVKGPAAATLYGSDAVAGVISIITKKGRQGAGFVQTMNVEYGEVNPNFTQPANFGVCSATALSRPTSFPNCVGKAEGTILSDRPLERDKSFGNGNYKNINYSLSGGGDRYSAYFSMGGNGDWGIVPNSFYGQINSRANFNYSVRDNLQMEFGFGLIRVETQLPTNDNNIYGYLGGGMLGDPRTIGAAKDGWYSQRQTLAISAHDVDDKTTRFQPRGAVNWMPFNWFKNRLSLGADFSRTEAFSFWAKNDQGWWDNPPTNTGEVGEARQIEDRFTLDYLGTLTHNLTKTVRADLSVGTQAQARRFDRTNVSGQGLINNEVRSVSAASTLLNGGQTSRAQLAGAALLPARHPA
jgi:TonB-dependent SusC/RagA subfamily outer membrane receptor